MANTGVKGKVTNESGDAIPGLTVIAYDVEVFTDEERLGSTTTLDSGEFTITYTAGAYGLESNPDLKIRVFDPVGRLLFESDEFADVTDTILDIESRKGNIIIPSDVARGFRVTLRKGYYSSFPPPPRPDPYPLLSQENLVTPMIDNEAAWAELTADVKASTNLVHIMQLWFTIGRLFTVFSPAMPPDNRPTTGDRLGNVLLERNRNAGVKVRILLCDFIAPPVPGILPRVVADIGAKYLADSVEEVKNYLEDEKRKAAHTVEMRPFPRPWNLPLHAKIVVIDSKTAYILGSPFIQGYYDAQTHRIFDPRHGIKSLLEHTDCAPLHEISVSVKGPAVGALNNTFLDLWNKVGTAVGPTPYISPGTTNAAVQIVRTLPAKLLPAIPDGETGILEAYQRAIREAEDFIYLDNQYFTEPLIADALVQALKDNNKLQVIMVLNSKVDIPGYFGLQSKLVNRMKAAVGEEARSRLGLFSLWSHETTSTPQSIIRIYTHAKVGVVDDKWATIGCANLDGVSLNSTQTLSVAAPGDQAEKRSIEVNALIFNAVDGLPANKVPDEFRRAFWAEHLGYNDPNHPDLQTPPTGGWLTLWNNHAAEKLAGLSATPPIGHSARILEWRPEKDPAKHLLALGLTKANLANLTFEDGGRSFDFATGKWL